MTVKEIIEKYLRDNGYDGLCGEDCGCGLDDFTPCMEPIPSECVPGYRVMCDGKFSGDENDDHWHDCPGVEHELFTTEKPTKKEGQ
jgi:hypothetical protein